jgi:hypothetical protein
MRSRGKARLPFVQRIVRWVRGEVVDLVLPSANEALENGIAFDEAAFARFIDIAALSAPVRIDYWRSLPQTAADPWLVKARLPPQI